MPPSLPTSQYPPPSGVAAMPTMGALGFATALAPIGVVPKGTTELGGGGAVDADTGAAASPETGTAARPSTATRPQHRRTERASDPVRRPGHPVHSLMASMSWRSRA